MKRIRYTMSARSQGKLYAQRQLARLAEKDVHRWLTLRLDGFYCDRDTPRPIGPALHAMARTDEALVKATGVACTPAPHMQSRRKER